MSDLNFPELALAARRLGLDEVALVESMLCRLGNDEPYWSALHGVIAEAVQRQGRYEGQTKAWIDSGEVFGGLTSLALETPTRLAEALKYERIDIFDALAVVESQRVAKFGEVAVADKYRERKEKHLASVAASEEKAGKKDLLQVNREG